MSRGPPDPCVRTVNASPGADVDVRRDDRPPMPARARAHPIGRLHPPSAPRTVGPPAGRCPGRQDRNDIPLLIGIKLVIVQNETRGSVVAYSSRRPGAATTLLERLLGQLPASARSARSSTFGAGTFATTSAAAAATVPRRLLAEVGAGGLRRLGTPSTPPRVLDLAAAVERKRHIPRLDWAAHGRGDGVHGFYTRVYRAALAVSARG